MRSVNSLKPTLDILKVFLKSSTKTDQHFPISLASDKILTTLYFRIVFLLAFFEFIECSVLEKLLQGPGMVFDYLILRFQLSHSSLMLFLPPFTSLNAEPLDSRALVSSNV